MDRAEEFSFAWKLLDHAALLIEPPARVQLCIKIGAGDLREAIIQLLGQFAHADMALPPMLAADLWAWLNGFTGSDAETHLRDLASRVRVSNVAAPLPTKIDTPPMRLMPRRSERAVRAIGRLTIAK